MGCNRELCETRNFRKAKELWERIENCGLLRRIVGEILDCQGKRRFWKRRNNCVGDKELRERVEDCGILQGIVGEIGELWVRTGTRERGMELCEKIENFWTIQVIMKDMVVE